jgi:endonuclease-3
MPKAKQTWKRPPRKRIERIRKLLRAYYGRPRNEPHHAPLDELVLTVLSQNTNDRNRDVAYARLRSRFPSWEQVAQAPQREVEDAIKPGGISKIKSKRIQAMLRAIEAESGSLDLEWLASAPRKRALEFLESLPGVGRKTAACVLLFSFDRPEMPVDTHVYRVSQRLDLLAPNASFDRAHDEWLALLASIGPRDAPDPADAYEIHVNLIRHGRRLCSSQRPACSECPLRRLCPFGKSLLSSARKL